MTLTFDEAIKSEFFSWFCLEPFGESSGPRRRFRPSGPAFRDLAEVGLKADGDAIEQAWLGLARSFIADGRNGPFARDMCRSFLQWAVREPSPRAKILIANIGRLDRGGPVIMRGPPPEPPEADTTGAYDVFMGHRRRASLEEDGVALENVRGPSPEGPASAEPGPAFPYGEPLSEGWLRIEVRLAPSTPAPWWRRFGFSR